MTGFVSRGSGKAEDFKRVDYNVFSSEQIPIDEAGRNDRTHLEDNNKTLGTIGNTKKMLGHYLNKKIILFIMLLCGAYMPDSGAQTPMHFYPTIHRDMFDRDIVVKNMIDSVVILYSNYEYDFTKGRKPNKEVRYYLNKSGEVVKKLQLWYDRSWYSDQVKKIDINIDPTEANARMVVGQRNSLKQQARDLMSDRKAAADLDISNPIQDFDYYNKKYSGDYSKIMKGGTTPNADVNKKLGVQ